MEKTYNKVFGSVSIKLNNINNTIEKQYRINDGEWGNINSFSDTSKAVRFDHDEKIVVNGKETTINGVVISGYDELKKEYDDMCNDIRVAKTTKKEEERDANMITSKQLALLERLYFSNMEAMCEISRRGDIDNMKNLNKKEASELISLILD